MSRLVYLVAVAMLIFAGGVLVEIFGDGVVDHVIGVIAMLGAVAIILANVNGTKRRNGGDG